MRELAGTKFHFVGVGGIGMCGLAELLHNLGASVSGSDLRSNIQTEHLKELGVIIYKGHSESNLKDVDVLVYSSAVKLNNPEVVEARKRSIPIIPRAEALAEIMNLRRGVAIAGTHGKTTTTSLTASVFLKDDKDPTIVVGGRLDVIKSTAVLGQGEWLIAEADESDGSFHKLSPEIVVITNIDNDHMDYYGSMENLERAYYDFALRVPFYGCAIVCGDDPRLVKLFKDFPKKVLFYGFGEHNDFLLQKEEKGYSIWFEKKMLQKLSPPIAGDHNALNCLAAFAVGKLAGLNEEQMILGLEEFAGVDRRFQFKGQFQDALIYDDYGHHPTEIKAVLKAFREKFPDKKLVVAFQPHRYSRFENCWSEFLNSFSNVDYLYVTPVYAAGEMEISGVNSQEFCQQIGISKVECVDSFADLEAQLIKKLDQQSVFVTLGAGDIYKVGESLCKK